MPFNTLLTLASEDTGLSIKKSPNDERKEKRHFQQELKRKIESTWAETDVECHLSQRIPFSARKKQRLAQYFETKAAANERSIKQAHRIETKYHVPTSINGDFDLLKEDIKTWNAGTPVNFSNKARAFNIRKRGAEKSPENAGQLLKEHLKKEGINIADFEPPNKSKHKSLHVCNMHLQTNVILNIILTHIHRYVLKG